MKNIKLYGYNDCPFCKELMGYLNEGKIKYKYIDVTKDEHKVESEKLFNFIKEEVVPILIIDKKVLVPNKSFKTIKEAYSIAKKLLNS